MILRLKMAHARAGAGRQQHGRAGTMVNIGGRPALISDDVFVIEGRGPRRAKDRTVW